MNALFQTNRKPLRSRIGLFLTVMLFALFAGCSTTGDFFDSTLPEDMNLNLSPELLVNNGMEEFNRGKYFVALEYFNKVLDTYRFSPQALLAELKVADCKYYMGKYVEALLFYEKFEEMHPTNEAMPYVMYQKAMCDYKRIDSIDRDITGATKAIVKFQQLLKAYPDSPYTQDARDKIRASKEFLANHEFAVAKFYQRTNQDPQAVIRLKYLISMYPDADIHPQAQQLLSQLEKE